jgi:hypothetical protein
MLPPQLFQIESRSQERLPGQTSTSPLKCSFLAVVMTDATVVRLTMPSSGCTATKSLMRLALSTELEVTIMVTSLSHG